MSHSHWHFDDYYCSSNLRVQQKENGSRIRCWYENKIKHSDHVHGIIETMYGWHGSLEWNQARNKQCPCRTLNLNICRDYFRFRNEAKVNDFLAHIN